MSDRTQKRFEKFGMWFGFYGAVLILPVAMRDGSWLAWTQEGLLVGVALIYGCLVLRRWERDNPLSERGSG